MATKKTSKSLSTSKTVRSRKPVSVEPTETSVEKIETALAKPAGPNLKFLAQLLIVLALGTGLFLLASKYRGLVVAAMVNRTPISTMQLNQVLTRRYGKSVLDELVAQELLTQEAQKQNIQVSKDDMDKEFKALEDRLGGADNLKQALTQYGLSQDDLMEQIRLRLIQTKLSDKLFSINVSDDDAKQYFTDNSALFKDKKLDDVKNDIKTTLKTQKQQEQFSKWFEDLKNKAQISIFIK